MKDLTLTQLENSFRSFIAIEALFGKSFALIGKEYINLPDVDKAIIHMMYYEAETDLRVKQDFNTSTDAMAYYKNIYGWLYKKAPNFLEWLFQYIITEYLNLD